MSYIILITKYLSGEATSQEKDELEAWRFTSTEHEQLFQELSESWSLTHRPFVNVIPDKEKVWQKIMIGINQMPPIKMYSRRIFYRAISIAATIALLVGFSIHEFFPGRTADGEVFFKAPIGQKAEVLLPDGTQVFLNSGSELAYSANYYNSKNRSVRLHGQAFFDVAKDEEHPFDVSVGNVKVVVHGTSFDINSYRKNTGITVSLLSGSVSIVSQSNEMLAILKPNQKAFIPYVDSNRCELSTCNASEESLWRYGQLKIKGELLTDVVRKMETWYGVTINLKSINVSKRYWMTIKTESLKEMLEIINRITPINYIINGEEVSITCR